MKTLFLAAALSMATLPVIAQQQVPCVPTERLASVMSEAGFRPMVAGLVNENVLVSHWVNIQRDRLMTVVVTTDQPSAACVMMDVQIVGVNVETLNAMVESQR